MLLALTVLPLSAETFIPTQDFSTTLDGRTFTLYQPGSKPRVFYVKRVDTFHGSTVFELVEGNQDAARMAKVTADSVYVYSAHWGIQSARALSGTTSPYINSETKTK